MEPSRLSALTCIDIRPNYTSSIIQDTLLLLATEARVVSCCGIRLIILNPALKGCWRQHPNTLLMNSNSCDGTVTLGDVCRPVLTRAEVLMHRGFYWSCSYVFVGQVKFSIYKSRPVVFKVGSLRSFQGNPSEKGEEFILTVIPSISNTLTECMTTRSWVSYTLCNKTWKSKILIRWGKPSIKWRFVL